MAEQEGLYYPTQPAAPGGAAAAGQNGQNPAMFKAWPKSGSPSVDRSLRKFASNREAGAGRPAEGYAAICCMLTQVQGQDHHRGYPGMCLWLKHWPAMPCCLVSCRLQNLSGLTGDWLEACQ